MASDSKNSALVIFGDKTAEEILCVARDIYGDQFAEIHKFVFNDQLEQNADFQKLMSSFSEISYIVGMIDVQLKTQVCEFAHARDMKPFSVVHTSAYVAPSARIGAGTFVAPQSVVSVNAVIGDHAIIHYHCSIGHDSVVGDFCSVLPGARVSGQVELETGVMVGSGAFVHQGTRVARYARVDALTYVRNDVPANRIVSCRM